MFRPEDVSMERFFDIVFSGLALLVLSPLLVPIVIILRWSGEGEIFFLQERVGRNGEVFKLYKFVTMLKDSPNVGTGTVTMKDDPRVLPVGKFLRKTKINELPQLLNIFFGDMSVIGPRPLTTQTFGAYSESTQRLIKQVRPGLSGVGSIIFRGEEEIMHGATASVDFYANVIAPYKGALEEWFVSNKSLYIYFVAIFVTVWAVLIPSTKIAWRVFKDLPEPPTELKQALNFTD
jgi:lipopolysaccharide/colanic/teichoic acid biosynthesis glycosyltransferase